MSPLLLDRMQWRLGTCKLDCVWAPALTLTPTDLEDLLDIIDAINARRRHSLRCGFFAPSRSREWKRQFLTQSIWCIVSDSEGPCGFAYHYDLGFTGPLRTIHAGLVSFSRYAGTELMGATSFCLIVGNLLNFGDYICTSITHIPMIASLIGASCRNVYPTPDSLDDRLRATYLPVLEMLTEHYIVPILECPRESICRETFRILGSLELLGSSFKTRRDILTAGPYPEYSNFMNKWLRSRVREDGHTHVIDDLIQVGEYNSESLNTPSAAVYLRCLNCTTILQESLGALVTYRLGAKAKQLIFCSR